MSLSAQDIVALARAGYNAAQISMLNQESLSTESTDLSTETTKPAPSTQPTEKPEVSTPSTPPEVKPEPAPADPAPTKQDPAPSMQDLMEKLAALEGRLTTAAINQDQQPDTGDQLTGDKVLAQILDPRIK